MAEASILLIEDDSDIRVTVSALLSREGYDLLEAESGEEGLRLFSEDLDLMILDIMLPGMSGIGVCKEIRKISNVPILFLTAKSKDSDKVTGLLAGGDDYLPKPFSFAELLGRVRALIRRYRVYEGKDHRNAGETDDENRWLADGSLRVSRDYNEVMKEDQECRMSDIEYRILRLLMEHPGQIFTAQMIYEQVWDEPFFYSCANTVTVHIRRLRKQIEEDPGRPRRILTVWGKGYRYERRY